jgi:hypothetical protein
MKKSIIPLIVLGVGGIWLHTTYTEGVRPVVYATEPEVITPKVVQIEMHPTALNEIADCESGTRNPDGTAVQLSAKHYHRDGTVVIGQHTRPEEGLDVGWAQINTKYHLKRSQELGIDIFTEEGNKKYARLLYREQGAGPWSASADCHGHK